MQHLAVNLQETETHGDMNMVKSEDFSFLKGGQYFCSAKLLRILLRLSRVSQSCCLILISSSRFRKLLASPLPNFNPFQISSHTWLSKMRKWAGTWFEKLKLSRFPWLQWRTSLSVVDVQIQVEGVKTRLQTQAGADYIKQPSYHLRQERKLIKIPRTCLEKLFSSIRCSWLQDETYSWAENYRLWTRRDFSWRS